MLLHTIIPYENIFPNEDKTEFKCIQVEHGVVEIEKSDTEYKIRRLISTLPADYLNPKYTPGNLFEG